MPKFLKKYFWDVDFRKLSLPKSVSFITARLLEYGDADSLRWLFRNVKYNTIKETVAKTRTLSVKSLFFWSSILGIDKKEILCLKKSYQKMQRTHWLQ